jgi:hypothetical protein
MKLTAFPMVTTPPVTTLLDHEGRDASSNDRPGPSARSLSTGEAVNMPSMMCTFNGQYQALCFDH